MRIRKDVKDKYLPVTILYARRERKLCVCVHVCVCVREVLIFSLYIFTLFHL